MTALRICCLALLLLGLSACSSEVSEEQQIIATIRNMEAALEEPDRAAFMDSIADDFIGNHPGMDRRGIRALLIYQMNRHRQIQARLLPIDVELQSETRGSAVFNVVVTGGSGWLPEEGQIYTVTTGWRKEGKDWMLITAQWEAQL